MPNPATSAWTAFFTLIAEEIERLDTLDAEREPAEPDTLPEAA